MDNKNTPCCNKFFFLFFLMRAKIRILTINDVYAFEPVQGLGGYAEVSTLIEQYRTENCLVMINGDFLGGSSLAEHFKGKCAVEVLDAIGIQYCVIGNHEFDFGNDILKEHIKNSKFRWLGSNIKIKETDELLEGITDTAIESFDVITDDGKKRNIKVGLFGVCTLDTPVLSWPGKDIYFEPSLECATKKCEELRDKCDLLVGITHLDLTDDLAIADANRNIDLILGGHEHFPYNHITKSGTLIFKAGQNAYWLGVIDYDIDITIDENGNEKLIFHPSWSMVANHNYKPNPNVLSIIDKYRKEKAEADKLIDKEELICTVKNNTLITKTSIVRTGPAQIMNIVADAILNNFFADGYQADFSIINGGIVRGDSSYPPNTKITRGILMDEVPFPLKLVMIRIKGKFVKEALEQHIIKYPAPVGSYPHVSKGLNVIFDGSRNPMDRIISIKLHGEPIDPEKEYLVTLTHFLSIGGDGCKGYTNSTYVGDSELLFDVLLSYLKSKGEINPVLEERLYHIKK